MDDKLAALDLDALNAPIVACRACPRLVEWRELVAREKRKSFAGWDYWGKPVPHFGDPAATHLIVGLAPAAHGANRTGRLFTGDRSGDWLFRALYKAGVANQPHAVSADDGLELTGVLITPICHCAPPDNKPLPEEIATCRPYLETLLNGRDWNAILCLGSLAWNALFRTLGEKVPAPFGHGVETQTQAGVRVLGSYHPSQQNTFTKRLTEPMLDEAIAKWLGRN